MAMVDMAFMVPLNMAICQRLALTVWQEWTLVAGRSWLWSHSATGLHSATVEIAISTAIPWCLWCQGQGQDHYHGWIQRQGQGLRCRRQHLCLASSEGARRRSHSPTGQRRRQIQRRQRQATGGGLGARLLRWIVSISYCSWRMANEESRCQQVQVTSEASPRGSHRGRSGADWYPLVPLHRALFVQVHQWQQRRCRSTSVRTQELL